jgi:DNA-binding cell septation regulator SpoVG
MLEYAVVRIFSCSEEFHPLKAIADVCVSDEIVIKGFKVVEGKNGLFVRYPSQKGKNNQFFKNVSLLNEEAASRLHTAVLSAYRQQPAS